MSYVDEEQLTIPKTFTFAVTEEETKENGDGDITTIPGIRVLFECTNIEQSINNRPAYIYTCSAIGNYDSIHV